MTTITPMLVTCKDCRSVLDMSPGVPPDKRQPCPSCGSTVRLCSMEIRAEIMPHSKCKLNARHRARSPFLELVTGSSFYRNMNKWVHRTYLADREKDWYDEVITYPITDESIHECHEPLHEHRGHGQRHRSIDQSL